MAIKNIVTRGYGIAGTGVKFIPTRGYKPSLGGHWWWRPWARTSAAAPAATTGHGLRVSWHRNRRVH